MLPVRSKVLSAVTTAAVMSLALAGCGPSKPVTISPKTSYTSVQMSKKCDELFGTSAQVGKRFHMTAPIARFVQTGVRGYVECDYEPGSHTFNVNDNSELLLRVGRGSPPRPGSAFTYETATSGNVWVQADEVNNAAVVSSKDRSWLESVAQRVKP